MRDFNETYIKSCVNAHHLCFPPLPMSKLTYTPVDEIDKVKGFPTAVMIIAADHVM